MQMLRANGTVQDVTIRYTGNTPVSGDLDFDRDVDLTDWALLKTGFSTNIASLSPAEKYGKGDFTLDGTINLADVNAFATAFDAMNGAGAFAALSDGSFIPEPGTLGLVLIAAAGVYCPARRRMAV